jgi:hypothetical protein
LLASLLLCATSAAHAEAAALPSRNNSKVQSSIGAPRELAVLLDEDPTDPKGKKYSGYVVWRIEKVQQAGEKPDVAICVTPAIWAMRCAAWSADAFVVSLAKKAAVAKTDLRLVYGRA